MPRNLDRRVETLFPIGPENLKQKLDDMMEITYQDTVKTRIQNPDGSYSRIKSDLPKLESQVVFHQQAKEIAKAKKRGTNPSWVNETSILTNKYRYEHILQCFHNGILIAVVYLCIFVIKLLLYV